jgi:hypothetical protein
MASGFRKNAFAQFYLEKAPLLRGLFVEPVFKRRLGGLNNRRAQVAAIEIGA